MDSVDALLGLALSRKLDKGSFVAVEALMSLPSLFDKLVKSQEEGQASAAPSMKQPASVLFEALHVSSETVQVFSQALHVSSEAEHFSSQALHDLSEARALNKIQ